MKFSILLIATLFSTYINAQIQYWTREGIIDAQFEPEHKAQKIKTAYNIFSNENFGVSDSTYYNEITQYNTNGQKTVYAKYKTDWVKKIRYYQTIDSVFYNDKGTITEYRRYIPKQDGRYYEINYRAVSTINANGLIERIDYYGNYYAEDHTGYELRTYNNKNQLIAATKYTTDNNVDFKWVFEYNKKGRITKVSTTSAWGEGSSYVITYTKKGLLESYTEFFEGKQRSVAKYTYDSKQRLTECKYTTNSNHAENTEYFYRDDETVPYRTHFAYPRGYNNPDFAHEHLAYKFDWF